MARQRTPLLLLSRCLHVVCVVLALCVFSTAANAQETPAPFVTGSGNGFIAVLIPNAGVYDVALAESALTTQLASHFPATLPVQCIDMRLADSTASSAVAFELLFLIGANPLGSTDALLDLQVDLDTLQQTLTQMLSSVAPSGLTLRVVSATDVTVQFNHPLPAFQTVPSPTDGSAFLRVDMNFRNLPSPANLTQSLLFQTRRGIQHFLSLASLAQVKLAGPPQVPASSVLLLSQSFFVVLNTNSTAATMDNRQRLANLLIYGDPTRPVTDSHTLQEHPAMFLDFAADEPLPDPTILLTLPFVFSSLSVDIFPDGNPPAPVPELPPGTVVIPATPTDQLLARIRKRHRFRFDATTTTTTESSGDCPTLTPSSNSICLKLQWRNAVPETSFWLENIESLDAMAWNVWPTTTICSSRETPTPLLPSPVISMGNASSSSSSAWALRPLTPAQPRVSLALNLRSLDNATLLKIEISADIRSASQAATTVTSIARAAAADVPVYQSKSNVVVHYDSLFRPLTNEIVLSLQLHASERREKDTSQPCAHCQNLYDWCSVHPACQALANCVFRDGIEASQTPATLLQQQPITSDSVADVSPHFRRCLTSDGNPAGDLDALLLLASAVRCQLQRLCTFRTPAYYGFTGLDDRLLLWESSDGTVQLTGSSVSDTVTLKLAGVTLCSFTPNAFQSAVEIQDHLARQCVYASYLGRVHVNLNASVPSVELRFQDLVGPLPTVESSAVAYTSVITALPALRLRLETEGFATALPPVPTPPTSVDLCGSKCPRLALDGCLRDLQCVSFTDCITRFTTPDDPLKKPLGESLLGLFERSTPGESLSFRAAVDACHSQSVVSDAAWRKLVDASACYAKHDCGISMQGVMLPVVPETRHVVGKWSVPPASQRLVFSQAASEQGGSSSVGSETVPLQLTDSTGSVVATATSSFDAMDLQRAIRSLLRHEDVAVRLVSDDAEPATGLRTVQWEVTYAFWLGRRPQFVDATRTPQWQLVDLPTQDGAVDYVLTMTATDNTTSSSSSSVTGASGSDAWRFVEIPATTTEA